MSDATNIITVHLTIHGRVQGVGFRESMRLVALALHLTGWVRNRLEGTVEAVIQGNEADVERLVLWCHSGPPGANVRQVEATLMNTDETYIAFSRWVTA
ncbi:MAG: acylphosphatase [Betaproteobacteria bacterium]|nr:acylphosphatase [Betaproteobacteria bacterium]